MATITERLAAATAWPGLDEQRIALYGIDWATYQKIAEAVGDGLPRLAYNRGVLELMSPGLYHEDYTWRLGRLVEMLIEELRISCKALRSTTWVRPDAERAIEADECYLLTPEKIAELRRRRPKTAAESPAPDLAIETDLRRSAVDRAEIYATLGVPEVWRFNGAVLSIDRLTPEGTYVAAEASQFLPITLEETVRWVLDAESDDDSAWLRRLREWIRAEILPR